MIDWTKPLEHVDGTPLVLDSKIEQADPDYYLRREDGLAFGESQRIGGEEYILITRPDGTQWNREDGILVRNRASSSRPSDELVERAKEVIHNAVALWEHFSRDEAQRIWLDEARAILSELNPIDPVVKRAREICAEDAEALSFQGSADSYRNGSYDGLAEMRIAIRALREGM